MSTTSRWRLNLRYSSPLLVVVGVELGTAVGARVSVARAVADPGTTFVTESIAVGHVVSNAPN
jgi:hypothetical protein